jgi:hypothetical protein
MGISRPTSCRMITGIIWKVEALPTPVKKNSAMKQAKNPQNAPGASLMPRKKMTPSTAAIMPRNTQKVTRPPPYLSDTQPVPARLSAPTRGPRKTNCRELTCGNS